MPRGSIPINSNVYIDQDTDDELFKLLLRMSSSMSDTIATSSETNANNSEIILKLENKLDKLTQDHKHLQTIVAAQKAKIEQLEQCIGNLFI